ncbi:MAG TPA: rhomboid family intramembrane serine protease [Candidatus Sulfotelmatobacter sp.]|nr:rhomboid family intramembrane serine protease [Candidatus Sulfotelmatobacter sp.]
MLPIKDDAPRLTVPFVNYFLIALNIAIYFFEWSLEISGGPRARQGFELQFAFVPRYLGAWMSGLLPATAAIIPFFSSMFLHASWPHVLLNMWGLAIFGDNVEDRLGHFLYLGFYILCGLGAAVTHLIFNFNSPVPTVGASGAIAGVMGAYLLLYPRARVLTWWGFFIVWLPAWLVLGYWFILNILSGAASALTVASAHIGGVAFWAHVGGFVTGALLIKLLPTRKNVYAFEDY